MANSSDEDIPGEYTPRKDMYHSGIRRHYEIYDDSPVTPLISSKSERSVNRVAIKPPVFYRSNPSVWFRQMESQFVIGGITLSTTKFHHILAALPEDVAINLPCEITDYDGLKEQICSIYQKSRQELIEEALGSVSLDGQKPSVCLMKIQRKLAECKLQVDDDIVRHRLMKAMPFSTRTALSAHIELPTEQFARLADTIYSYSKSDTVAAVSSTSAYPHSYQAFGGEQEYFGDTVAAVSSTNAHQHPYQTLGGDQTSFSSNNRGGYFPRRGRGDTRGRGGNFRGGFASSANFTLPGGFPQISDTHRPYSEGQRPKVCRSHLYYAANARTCKPWCKWPGAKPQQIDPSSRPASPMSGN